MKKVSVKRKDLVYPSLCYQVMGFCLKFGQKWDMGTKKDFTKKQSPMDLKH